MAQTHSHIPGSPVNADITTITPSPENYRLLSSLPDYAAYLHRTREISMEDAYRLSGSEHLMCACRDIQRFEAKCGSWEQEKSRLLNKCSDTMAQTLEYLASWKHAAQVAEAEKLVHKQRAKALAMRLARAEALLKRAKAVQHG